MAINAAAVDGQAFTAQALGFRTDRATAALPATTAAPIFNITGGRVIILGIIGQVTTVIQTQANDTKLISNPTAGSSLDICAVLDITADEVGCLYGITGVPGDALIGANAGASPLCSRMLVLPVGAIDLSCAATNTGSVKWSVLWLPLDDGAAVTAA